MNWDLSTIPEIAIPSILVVLILRTVFDYLSRFGPSETIGRIEKRLIAIESNTYLLMQRIQKIIDRTECPLAKNGESYDDKS